MACLASLGEVFGLFGFPLIASYGASTAIVVALPESNFASVKNIIFGSLISAVVGVMTVQYLSDLLWLNVAMAVSLSIVLMITTNTFHPPGGAIALIAVSGTEELKQQAFVYFFTPVFIGSLVIAVFAFFYREVLRHTQKGYLAEKQ